MGKHGVMLFYCGLYFAVLLIRDGSASSSILSLSSSASASSSRSASAYSRSAFVSSVSASISAEDRSKNKSCYPAIHCKCSIMNSTELNNMTRNSSSEWEESLWNSSSWFSFDELYEHITENGTKFEDYLNKTVNVNCMEKEEIVCKARQDCNDDPQDDCELEPYCYAVCEEEDMDEYAREYDRHHRSTRINRSSSFSHIAISSSPPPISSSPPPISSSSPPISSSRMVSTSSISLSRSSQPSSSLPTPSPTVSFSATMMSSVETKCKKRFGECFFKRICANDSSSYNSTVDGTISPSSTVIISVSSSVVEEIVCINDCNDVCNGTAELNECDICVLGNTGKLMNDSKDCNGDCYGTWEIGKCGCSDPDEEPDIDCNGDCFGLAEINSCGNCTGGETNLSDDFGKDACGVCDGGNRTCLGCDGVPNSGKVFDACGECNGNGSSCKVITMVEPYCVPNTGMNSVKITGAGLSGDVYCSWKSGDDTVIVQATLAADSSGLSMHCSVPPGNASSVLSVIVNTDQGNQTLNETLSIKYFDTATISVTAIEPTKTPYEDKPTYVNITGTGFANCSKMLCLYNGQESKATFVSDMLITCEIPENLTETSGFYEVGLKINGLYSVTGSSNLNLTLVAKPPVVLESKFTDTGVDIDIFFDSAVEIPEEGYQNCDEIFVNISTLGESPICYWTYSELLTISLGEDSTIKPDDKLIFKSDAIKNYDEAYPGFASGEITINKATNAMPPIAILEGPTQISPCANFTLDCSLSSGNGLEFKWKLESPSNANIQDFLKELSTDESIILVDASTMTVNQNYKFKCEVKNAMEETDSDTIEVMKKSIAIPSVIANPISKIVYISEPLKLSVEAEADAPCVNGSKVNFTWSVSCDNTPATTKITTCESFMQTKQNAEVYLETKCLTAGVNCTFAVEVIMANDPESKVIVDFDPISLKGSQIEAQIYGGERTVGTGSGEFELDGISYSYDPDDTSDRFVCTWTCKVDGKTARNAKDPSRTLIPGGSGCIVKIPADGLVANKVYTFKLSLKKGSRKAEATTTITAAAGSPPSVVPEESNIKISRTEHLFLSATINCTNYASHEWKTAQETGYSTINNLTGIIDYSMNYEYDDGTIYVDTSIKPGTLLGTKYIFLLTVTCENGVGNARVLVEMYKPPDVGKLKASSMKVNAFEDITLSVTAISVYSTLFYSFGYIDENGDQAYSTYFDSEKNVIVTVPGFAEATNITFFVEVYDDYENVVMRTLVVAFNATEITVDYLQTEMEGNIDKDFDSGNWRKGCQRLTAVFSTISSAEGEASSDGYDSIFDTSAGLLYDTVDAIIIDDTTANFLIKTLSQIPPEKATKNKDQSLKSIKKIANGMKKIDSDNANVIMGYASSIEEDDSYQEGVEEVYDAVETSFAKSVSLAVGAMETDPKNNVVIRAEVVVTNTEIKTSSASGAPTFQMGDDVLSKFKSTTCDQKNPKKKCQGVVISSKTYKDGGPYKAATMAANPEVKISAETAVDIQASNPTSGVKQEIKDLTNPVTINFNTPLTGDTTPICLFYDTTKKTFSEEGLTSEVQSNGGVKCHSTHLTAFAIGSKSSTTPTDNVEYKIEMKLTNETYTDVLANSSSPEFIALATKITTEFSTIFKSVPQYVKAEVVKFTSGSVNVESKLTFKSGYSSSEVKTKLETELNDGVFAGMATDKDSLKVTQISTGPVEEEEEDNTGAIVGGVIGGILAVALICGIAYYFWRRNKIKNVQISASNENMQLQDHAA